MDNEVEPPLMLSGFPDLSLNLDGLSKGGAHRYQVNAGTARAVKMNLLRIQPFFSFVF